MKENDPDQGSADDAPPTTEAVEEPPHPIAEAINRLVHGARDIKLAVRQFMPIAQKSLKQQIAEVIKVLESNIPLTDDPDPHTRVLAQKQAELAMYRYRRLENSSVPAVVENGLFLALFSAFDAFTGDLLRGLYARKPALFKSLTKSVTFAEVLEASSIEQLKRQVLDDEIETLRRKSYSDQFASLTQRFGVELTAFARWPEFVEVSQRRNLITHCDGIVNDQYISVCRDAGIKDSDLPPSGSHVRLGPKYFYAACELVIEVGIKLGQTLWRKTLPDEIALTDQHLMAVIYDTLVSRNWSRASMIGEFAYGQKKWASDEHRKIIVVNYAQALKRNAAGDLAKKMLGAVDWTAAANDFKLAQAVLLERYDDAAELMRKIGKEGERVKENSYHTWPLFIEFRETEQFAKAYQQVFGHPYADQLKKDADKASKDATAAAQRHSDEQPLAAEPEGPTRDTEKAPPSSTTDDDAEGHDKS